MTTTGEAWFLYAGDAKGPRVVGTLRREKFELPAPADDEVLIAPLFGSWEGNMTHAIKRSPVDICRLRGEERVILGNSGVVRVLKTGLNAKHFREGQLALIHGAAQVDDYGYPIRILGYDCPKSMGVLSTRSVVPKHCLVALPENSRFALAQWAAFNVRYITAWANWRVALQVYRAQVSEAKRPRLRVWGWGGGTTLAELDLAARAGHEAVMLSSRAEVLEVIGRTQVTPIDRAQFEMVDFEEKKMVDPVFREAYTRGESAFLAEMNARTQGAGVDIFVDYIGTAVSRATVKSLARCGVICSAGWKSGMDIRLVRAIECIQRHQYVNTHFANYEEAVDAVAYAAHTGWMPEVDDRRYSFDEVPELALAFEQGRCGLFPVYSINQE